MKLGDFYSMFFLLYQVIRPILKQIALVHFVGATTCRPPVRGSIITVKAYAAVSLSHGAIWTGGAVGGAD